MHKFLLLPLLFFLTINFVFAAEVETVVIQPGPDEGKDALYGTVYYQDGYSDYEKLIIGGWGDHYYSFAQFDISELPFNASIVSAELSLFHTKVKGSDNEGRVLRIEEEWTPVSITLQNNPLAVEFGSGWSSILAIEHWWNTDVTNVVKDWHMGTHPNYGFKLEGRYNSNDHGRQFNSSDYLDDPTLRPKLVITYALPEEGEETVASLTDELKSLVTDAYLTRRVRGFVYTAMLDRVEGLVEKGKNDVAEKRVGIFIKTIQKDEDKGRIDESTEGALIELAEKLLELIRGIDTTNEVPLITQVASPYPPESTSWFGETYANGAADSSCGTTIAECGCVLSSLAMIAQYYGVTKGIDGSDVNPLNMNEWLEENDGYTPDGGMLWSAGLRYLGEETNGTVRSHLQLESHNEADMSIVDSFIEEHGQAMAFSNTFGHFYLLTGLNEDGSYNVRDPFWFETKTTNDAKDIGNDIQDYNNQIDKANLFAYSKTPKRVARMIEVHLGSPAELLLIDADGNKLGYDPETGEVVNEIPGGSYDQSVAIVSSEDTGEVHTEKVLMVLIPEDEEYSLEVIGTGDGEYNLTIATVDDRGELETDYIEGETEVGERDTYSLDFKKKGYGHYRSDKKGGKGHDGKHDKDEDAYKGGGDHSD